MYLNPVPFKVMCRRASPALPPCLEGAFSLGLQFSSIAAPSSRGTRRKASCLFDISSWRKHTISVGLVKHFTPGFHGLIDYRHVRPRNRGRLIRFSWSSVLAQCRRHARLPRFSAWPTMRPAIHSARQEHILFADGRLVRRRSRGLESVSQVNSGPTTSAAPRGGRPTVPLSWIVP